jgi:hypothetical protein
MYECKWQLVAYRAYGDSPHRRRCYMQGSCEVVINVHLLIFNCSLVIEILELKYGFRYGV